jgi:Penicillin-insensitive murein endopeptidase
VISVAGASTPNAVGLVQVVAFALDEGESFGEIFAEFGDTPLVGAVRPSNYPISDGETAVELTIAPELYQEAFAPTCRPTSPGLGRQPRWGHCRVVRAVLRGIAAYRRHSPHAPPVAVGDMGLRHGGEIDGHSTHENGRPIDLYYPRRDRTLRAPHTVAQVDMRCPANSSAPC